MNEKYKEPVYALRHEPVKFDLKRTAFVIIDPQVDFLSPKGVMWEVIGNNVQENNTVENLEKLFVLAKHKNLPLIISPHYYFDHDYHWIFGGPGEHFMHDTKMFKRDDVLSGRGLDNSGADFLEIYKPYIKEENVVVCSPHKIFGPQTNDVILQLRKRGVDTIILAGMAANLCVESHLRDFIEQGFEVVVVKDAVAGPQIPEGDGYLSALINYRFLANELIMTEDLIKRLQ